MYAYNIYILHCRISGDKRALNLDYFPFLRRSLTNPLVNEGAGGVKRVVEVMNEYDLLREDFDNIISITQWPGMVDPLSKIDSKVSSQYQFDKFDVAKSQCIWK